MYARDFFKKKHFILGKVNANNYTNQKFFYKL